MNAALIRSRAAALFGAAALVAPRRAGRRPGCGGGGTIVTVGVGAQVYPKYPGADDYGIFPCSIVGFRREGIADAPSTRRTTASASASSAATACSTSAPPSASQSEREEDDVGAPVGDVGFTVEAGGFVEVFPVENFRHARRASPGHRRP